MLSVLYITVFLQITHGTPGLKTPDVQQTLKWEKRNRKMSNQSKWALLYTYIRDCPPTSCPSRPSRCSEPGPGTQHGTPNYRVSPAKLPFLTVLYLRPSFTMHYIMLMLRYNVLYCRYQASWVTRLVGYTVMYVQFLLSVPVS